MPKSPQKADQPQADAVKLAEVTKAKLEGQFFTFVVYLSQLYQRIDALRSGKQVEQSGICLLYIPDDRSVYSRLFFCVGCRFWRAWWLYNEVTVPMEMGRSCWNRLKKPMAIKLISIDVSSYLFRLLET